MKAEYTVKLNGKWYKAGDELPGSISEAVETPRESLVDDDMPMSELRKLAKEKGISVPIGTSKAKLKEMLGI